MAPGFEPLFEPGETSLIVDCSSRSRHVLLTHRARGAPGGSVLVSDNDGDIQQQCGDAVEFLREFEAEVRSARTFPGAELAVLDLAAAQLRAA